MPGTDEQVSTTDESASPLSIHREFVLEQRAREQSYEVIAELLTQRGVQTSPTAVGRFCRKHVMDEEVSRRKMEFKDTSLAESHVIPATPAEFEAMFATARDELQAMLDARLNGVSAAAASIEKSRAQLAEMRATIHERPAVLAKQLETELQAPVAKALQRIKELETQLGALLVATRGTLAYAERRLLLAAWTVGVLTGGLGYWLLLAR